LTLGHPVLFAPGFDDSVHGSFESLWSWMSS
jgi:hypothetical protein